MSRKKRPLCARVLAICPGGKIVVLQKPDGHIEFPGGSMLHEDQQDPMNTALRELFEETAIEVSDGHSRLTEIHRAQKTPHHVWICYVLHLQDDEVKWYRPESNEGRVEIMCPRSILDGRSDRMTERQWNILQKYVAQLTQ
jgi:8-oxo-dGTP pyrophosphatase MutT (NUDIX family)